VQPKVDNRDWSSLSLGQRIQQIEVEGFLVLPDLLAPDHIARLKSEIAPIKTTPVDYSIHQRGARNLQFRGGGVTELIAHRPTIEFLKALLGDEMIFMGYSMAISEPGHPGISLHTDGQPYGSNLFGSLSSCPVLVRVLYYLDDLTPQASPFRCVPRSHLSMHADANPYMRLESHPEELMVPAKAGSAVLINHRVFHGNYPNTGDYARTMLAIQYRPAWAGPQEPVEPWDPSKVAALPQHVKPFFADTNTRLWDFYGANKPPNMASQAPGMNPSRWQAP